MNLFVFNTESGPQMVNMAHLIKTVLHEDKVIMLLTEGEKVNTGLTVEEFINVVEEGIV